MSNTIPASVRIQHGRAARHARSAGLLIALLFSSALPQVARAQSCGEAGGDYCSQSGSCPANHISLGATYDCNPCCQFVQQGPSCGDLGGNWCSQSGGCPSGYDSVGTTYDCNPCCRQRPQGTMSFSVYTTSSLGSANLTAYTSVIDHSSGCTHANYTTGITLISPSGRQAQGSSSGLQASATISLGSECGTYTAVTRGTYNCSCFHWQLAAFGGATSIWIPYPGDLRSRPPDQTVVQSVGAYAHQRTWQVYHLDGETPWQFVAPVTENFQPAFPDSNGCRLTVKQATTSTNNVGRFTDCYGSVCVNEPPIGLCVQGLNCISSFTQTISVMGVPFPHLVVYGCNSVAISRP